MDEELLNIGDFASESPVGPGAVTGFNKNGYPEVNGLAVGWLKRADGMMYGAQGRLRVPSEYAPKQVSIPFMTTKNSVSIERGNNESGANEAHAPTEQKPESPQAPQPVAQAIAAGTANFAHDTAGVEPLVHIEPMQPKS